MQTTIQVAILGVNHKVASVPLRESIAKALTQRFFNRNPLSDGACFTVLSTCNRSEIYLASSDLTETHQEVLSILRNEVDFDFEQKCYSFFGKDCLLHLARVTAGLDSAVVAETEIQGQVRIAYEQAASTRTLCSDMHFLFQKALKIGKEIRSKFLFQNQLPGLEHAIFAKVQEAFQKEVPATLFVGVSEINLKIAEFLLKKGYPNISFTNRSKLALERLNNTFYTIHWELFHKEWAKFDCIICATKSQEYLIDQALYSKAPRKRLLIDLSIPRNIDPEIRYEILNIDSLQEFLDERNTHIQNTADAAEQHIATATERLLRLRNQRCAPLFVSASILRTQTLQ